MDKYLPNHFGQKFMNEAKATDLAKQISKHNLWSALFDLCSCSYRSTDGKVFLLPCPCSDKTGCKSILFAGINKCTWSCTNCGASKNNGKWYQLLKHLRKHYMEDDIFELAQDLIGRHEQKLKDDEAKLAERLKAYGVHPIKAVAQ